MCLQPISARTGHFVEQFENLDRWSASQATKTDRNQEVFSYGELQLGLSAVPAAGRYSGSAPDSGNVAPFLSVRVRIGIAGCRAGIHGIKEHILTCCYLTVGKWEVQEPTVFP